MQSIGSKKGSTTLTNAFIFKHLGTEIDKYINKHKAIHLEAISKNTYLNIIKNKGK